MINQEVNEIINSFEPIGLSEMDTVKLMNRIDAKYILSVNRIPELLKSLGSYYKVLEIDKLRAFSYDNTYYDTFDYLFYHQHQRGKLERNKVRYRKYTDTNTTFLEIKRRTNKNRTIKWRIVNSIDAGINSDEKASQFLEKHLSMSLKLLKPVLLNRFTRITLVGRDMKERVTLDYDLSFSDLSGRMADLPFIAIVEIKRESGTNRSQIATTLKEHYIRPTGFSKYCIGTSILYDLPRKNKLKSKILFINKLEDEFNKHVCA